MIPTIVVIPIIFAFLLSIITLITRNEKLINSLFLFGIFTPWLIFISFKIPTQKILGNWTRFTGIEVAYGELNHYFLLAELIIFSLVSIYSLNYFEQRKSNKVFSLILSMHAGLLGAFISRDLFNFYIYMEIASVSVFSLVAISNTKGSKKAAFRYIIFYFIASYIFILSIAIIYMENGYLNLHLIKQNLNMTLEVKIALGLAITGLILKAGIFPLYFWLPDAHSKAQTPISALLSGIMVKSSIFGILLITTHFPLEFLFPILKIVAFASMFFGVILALLQTNVKRLLAYHTVSQLGYVLLGIATSNVQGAILHAFAHALFKSGLFLGVGTLVDAQKTKNLKKLSYKGNYTLIISILFLSLAIGGMPPFIGAVSKETLLHNINGIWKFLFYLVSIGTLTSFMKLNYYLFKNKNPTRSKTKSVLITLCSGLLTLAFGLYFMPQFKLINIPLLVFAAILLLSLKYTNILDLTIRNPIKKRANGIGEENNFYSAIFVIFLISILIQII